MFEAWGIVELDNVDERKIKKEIKEKYKIDEDPIIKGRSFEMDISNGFVKDYLNLPHAFRGVRFCIYEEIPGLEPFGLEGEDIELQISQKGKVQVYLKNSTTRSAQSSFRNYLKGLGYKSVSFVITG